MAHEKPGARLRPARPARTRPPGRPPAWAAALALTAALTVALAVAGCAAAPGGPTTASGSAAAGSGPALTQAEAGQAFDAYVATSNRAAATGDGKLALSVVTGAQQSLVSATLDSHPVTSGTSAGDSSAYSSTLTITPSLSQYAYGTPTFYLAEPSGYPRFFLADVTRSDVTDGRSATADGSGSTGAAVVAADGPVLMLFEQSAAAGPWRLASLAQFSAGATLPALAAGTSGYVPQVPMTSTGLLAQPYATGPLQAAVVDDGPSAAAAQAVAPGPLTTGLYQAARDRSEGAGNPVSGIQVPAGDVYQWSMEGTPYPALALRTAAGGALVLYSMYLNSTVAVPGYFDDASPVNPGAPIKVPLDVLTQLPSGQPAPRIRLEVQSLDNFTAVDPPAAPAKITVLATAGDLNYATAS